MKPDQKKLLVVGGIGVLVILVVIYLVVAGKKTSKQETNGQMPTEVVVPTVDSKVKVDLISSNRKEATLFIRGIPNGTTSITYELSYATKDGGLQGANGTVNLTKRPNRLEPVENINHMQKKMQIKQNELQEVQDKVNRNWKALTEGKLL